MTAASYSFLSAYFRPLSKSFFLAFSGLLLQPVAFTSKTAISAVATTTKYRFRMNSPGSPGDNLFHIHCHLLSKPDRLLARRLEVPVTHRRRDPHQRRIGAVQADCVHHQIKLAPILARHHPPVRLIPVQDYLLVQVLAYDVKVHRYLTPVRQRELVNLRNRRLPAGARQAVFRGVNLCSCPLRPEIPYVESQLAIRWRKVGAVHVVGNAQHLQRLLIKRELRHRPVAPDVLRELAQRAYRRSRFAMRQEAQSRASGQQHRNHRPISHRIIHARTYALAVSPSFGIQPIFLRTTIVRLCSARNSTVATTKITQPENSCLNPSAACGPM